MLQLRGLSGRGRPPGLCRRLRAADGYAAVDSLVALMILSSTLVFAIAAGHTGRQAARAALEAREARALLQATLERAPPEPGVTQGAGGGFTWRLEVREPTLVAGATALCRRDATVTALATERRYALSTAVICPTGDEA